MVAKKDKVPSTKYFVHDSEYDNLDGPHDSLDKAIVVAQKTFGDLDNPEDYPVRVFALVGWIDIPKTKGGVWTPV